MPKSRFRFFLYLIPLLMDTVTGIFYYIGPVRATLLGYDVLVAGSMVTVRAACVFAGSLLFAPILKPTNAVRFMFGSNILMLLTCLLGLRADNLAMLYATSALSGFFMVMFFTAFQVFMKMVDSEDAESLARVVGSYTMAWCLGTSFGPFVTGFLMKMGNPKDGVGLSVGWIYTYLAAALLIAVTFGVLLWIWRKARAVLAGHYELAASGAVGGAERDGPDLAWLGWLMSFVAYSALGVLWGVFPAGITEAGISEMASGVLVMLIAMSMGLFAFWLSRRGGRWMFSGRAVLRLGLMGAIGVGLYTLPELMGWQLLDHLWPFALAALLAGSYVGAACLYGGYHALSHPEKAGRNISLNESAMAAGTILGSLGGGWLAKHYGFHLPFAIATAAVLVLALFQWRAHRGRE